MVTWLIFTGCGSFFVSILAALLIFGLDQFDQEINRQRHEELLDRLWADDTDLPVSA